MPLLGDQTLLLQVSNPTLGRTQWRLDPINEPAHSQAPAEKLADVEDQ